MTNPLEAKKYTVDSLRPRLEPFLQSLVTNTGFNLHFEVAEGMHTHPDLEDPEVVVKFSGPDVDLLLSNKAELLLALEQLCMEMLRMPADDHSLLCFDANDYRIVRMEELRISAIAAADRVKKSRTPFHFSPMSSRERRILHLSLRNETEVKSESTGMGSYRQVVVMPHDMMTVPEPIRPPRPEPPRERDFRGRGPGGRDSRSRFGRGPGGGGRGGDRPPRRDR